MYSIVALAGLGGHALGSFKERRGTHVWLRDDLPFDFPGARVLIYGYDTKVVGSQSFQDLESLASTFRLALKTIRPNSPVSKVRFYLPYFYYTSVWEMYFELIETPRVRNRTTNPSYS